MPVVQLLGNLDGPYRDYCESCAVCRVGQATAPAHHSFDLVGLRSAGPTLQIHKLASHLTCDHCP